MVLPTEVEEEKKDPKVKMSKAPPKRSQTTREVVMPLHSILVNKNEASPVNSEFKE